MASIDFQDGGFLDRSGPRTDVLGVGLFSFHILVSAFALGGWMVPSAYVLALYLLLLPAMAGQWYFNRGSCVLNNFETWLRTGYWRDPVRGEDGRFLQMLAMWLLGIKPSVNFLDRLAYGFVFVLWILGAIHLAMLTAV